jgi:hypothetical protein
MTGLKLQEYLQDLGLFKTENVSIVEVIDDKVWGTVPAFYKFYMGVGIQLEISIRYEHDKEKYVYIKSGKFEVANHKLSELTLPILCEELDKVLCTRKEFVDWMNRTLRDYKIDKIII